MSADRRGPDRDEPEWWAGAPSVVQTADGRFFLAARMRAWRYSCWLPVGDEIHVYAELTCADDTNEIRRFVLPARGLVRA